ncbi:MAG TPA: tetratricopeptide repeat protein [Candidatus Pelagibacter sp.]|jgi:Flp pilus assembly protein TadD|nr:tetratricopeptide repeat protein [Candidatus Pelagibacter sp.]
MKKSIKFLIIIFTVLFFNSNLTFAAMSGSSDSDKLYLYKQGKKLVYKAKKLEKKNKLEKAKKLYFKAYDKFEKAYAKDKKNADILNYLGYTLRKTGNLEKAEVYYLKGLKLDASHLGINEYLGELYVETNRIGLAKERLEVLNGCQCEEYSELKELIENN